MNQHPRSMKRRAFVKGVGLGSAAVLTPGTLPPAGDQNGQLPSYSYGKADSLGEALTAEGLLMLRIELPDGGVIAEDVLKVRKGRISRWRAYFRHRIGVLWIENPEEGTTVELKGAEKFRFTVAELLEKNEISGTMDGQGVTVNLLMDHEIGEVTLTGLGIREPGEEFSFVAMADPQGGNPDDRQGLKTRMKIHNAFVEESVDLVNQLPFSPLFAMVIGDVCDDWGYEKDLVQMNRFLSRMKCPVLYGIGNHETLLRSEFGPGYNMKAFHNYMAAQKQINGLDKLLYSFNAGRWHFVVWPDPLRDNFWETHPHYFEWLERDLLKYRDRPTMVFQHVPSHPIGISPHINYAESVDVKRTLLELLSRNGNVKVVLSGHVHIPLKASMKTAVSYRGMTLISLPAAGYRPRAFGEADYFGGPSQGVALVHISGDEAGITFKTVTEEHYEYPAVLPVWKENDWPLWLAHPWELPAENRVRNGNFAGGLEGWARRYVYMEDDDPSNRCEVRPLPDDEQGQALYLYARRRGYMAPGQDRLPQDINRIGQAVLVPSDQMPLLQFRYRIDGAVTDPNGFSGGYVWVEGFSGSRKVFNLLYSAGPVWVNIGGKYAQIREFPHILMDLPAEADRWHRAELNIGADYDRAGQAEPFNRLGTDRLLLHLGVWNLNDGEEQPFGIYFTGLEVQPADAVSGGARSQVNGHPVDIKRDGGKWWRNKIWPWKNIAGEHRYIIATEPFPNH